MLSEGHKFISCQLFRVYPIPNPTYVYFQALSNMEEFRNLDRDIEGSAKRWKKFVESECPEKEKFPQEWKNKTALQKLCMMRALRPDRMTYAVRLVANYDSNMILEILNEE